MKRLQGFYEFEFQSGSMTYVATVELTPPGMEPSEAQAEALKAWMLHFAISAPIDQGGIKCVDVRPIEGKPADALKVPIGCIPVFIWKSVEK